MWWLYRASDRPFLFRLSLVSFVFSYNTKEALLSNLSQRERLGAPRKLCVSKANLILFALCKPSDSGDRGSKGRVAGRWGRWGDWFFNGFKQRGDDVMMVAPW